MRAPGRFLVPALAALGACATQPNVDELTSGVVVATKFAKGVDFGSFDTFAVNPTVAVVRDVGDSGVLDDGGGTLAPESALAIVNSITAHMTARGYQLVTLSEQPELGMQATVLQKLGTVSVASSGYWWGAPGFPSSPAYWGFPTSAYFEPWSYSSSAYKSGTLVIECVNLRDAGAPVPIDASVGQLLDGGAAGHLEIVWTAYAHAVTQELLTSFGPQAQSAIDQAFLQSPYLQRRGTPAP